MTPTFLGVVAASCKLLEDEGHACALIGGLAVSVWAEPRFTRDVDLALSIASDEAAEELIHSLVAHGYRGLATIEQTAKARLSTARLVAPHQPAGGIVVDLLFASSGIEPELVSQSVELDIGSVSPVPVARIGHLIALKLLSHDTSRPQDEMDLVALRNVLDDVETEAATSACRMIERRGYARGRPLGSLLNKYLRGGRG